MRRRLWRIDSWDESGKVEIAETRRVVVAIVVRMVVVIVVTAEGEEVVT